MTKKVVNKSFDCPEPPVDISTPRQKLEFLLLEINQEAGYYFISGTIAFYG